MHVILPIVCILLYLFSATTQYLGLLGRFRHTGLLVMVSGILAVLTHGELLHSWIDLAIGQNLTFFNMFSFIIWLICLWVLLGTVRHPLQNLCVFTFPLAALSVLLAAVFPGYYVLHTAQNPKQLIHILTAAVAFSVLGVAAFQTVLLRIQEGLLRRNYVGNFIEKLPPLETMERLLFQMIGLGFFLLTLVLITSMYFFNDLFKLPLLQKTILVLIIWVIFAVLLVGRYFFGWRGRKIVYYTFSGFILLTVVYFSS
ncbi:MAG TPA: cytochrome c biogenesis protein CcsA [Gammaproteobacteria bacterium]|nr:cytochrome c biogenesis protein CcsA [Gammaproteobacteria bacterium]